MASRGKPKIDWKEAKRVFVEEGVTKREIARRFGVQSSTVQKHARAEDWDDARGAFVAKTTRQSMARAASALSLKSGSVIERLGKLSEDGLESAENLMYEDGYRENRATLADLTKPVALYLKAVTDMLALQREVDDMLSTFKEILFDELEEDDARRILGRVVEAARA